VIGYDALNRAAQSGSGTVQLGSGVRQPVTCFPDMPIAELFPLVLNTRYPIAVIDDRGTLQGMINKDMLLEALAHDIDYDEDEVEAPPTEPAAEQVNTEVTSV
jgi:glycine betaine/proline transport system ATP-binding protein